MMRRWVGVAVIAGCLGLVQAARAQVAPAPAGAGLPEPIPFCPQTGPNLVPGPLSSSTAPPGPPDCLSLPNDGTGAFPCCPKEPEDACFVHLGANVWQRQRLASDGVVAVQDAGNIDTGNLPPANAAVLQQFSDIHPHFIGAPRATVGYLCDSQAVEVTGFWVPENNSSVALSRPGRIDSFFINPPLGFEGDNGMFLQDDRVITTLSSTFWSVEANYRYSDAAVTGAELIVGVRYFDLEERLASLFDDDGVAFPMFNGQPDPARVATYSVRTHSHLIAPQLGFEWEKALTCFMDVGVTAKGAWGANFVQLERRLVRGDGHIGFLGDDSETQFSQMYEINGFVDFRLLERARLRLGYSTMWFLNMPDVVSEYDFNLENTSNFNSRNGSIFFHGPMAELQLLF